MTVAGVVNTHGGIGPKTALLQNHPVASNADPQDANLARLRFVCILYYGFLLVLISLIFNFLFLIVYDLFILNALTSNLVDVPSAERVGALKYPPPLADDFANYVFEEVEWEEQPSTITPLSGDTCGNIPNADRMDCFPRGKADESACTSRGCCWNPVKSVRAGKEIDVPWCYYPEDFKAYVQINKTVTNHVTTVFMKNVIKSPYPDDAPIVKMVITPETNNRVHIKITDATKERFETPWPETPVMHKPVHPKNLNFDVIADNHTSSLFTIKRKSDGKNVFDANSEGFIFSSQMIQISSKLPSTNVYGLGEHRNDFVMNFDWNRITLFNHDSIPTDGINGYGSHPFFLNVANGGKSAGVFLKNSHPLEIILQPAPAITYRVIGGVLDLYFFMGPSPSEVISQYLDVVGYPFMPPYWSLGFHMCKYGQKSLQVTKDVLNRTRSAGIPVDVQWNDIDYMDLDNDFTRDKKNFADLPQFIQSLHDAGMHYVPILDPGVSAGESKGSYAPFDEGLQLGIFVKNSSGLPAIGKVWNRKSTVFPDFTNPNTLEYWIKQLKGLHDDMPFDGLWIDMNEPSNFVDGSFEGCPNNTWENPPFVPTVDHGYLRYHTLCMSAEHARGKHYQLHNVHGFTEAIATNFALKEIRNKRPFIISRSSFAGHGKYAGHWTGDVVSSWDDMKHSVGDIMSFNMFGIPMVGADICGFNGNTTQPLCQRWLQLGAFYPFSRTHSSDDTIDQDPVAMGKEVVESTKLALEIRYSLLSYLYSLFWRAHAFGETVVRPLFFEFPSDARTYNISTQFMWGSAIMIVPVLKEGATSVKAYLPGEFWYDLINGKEKRQASGDVELVAPLNTIRLFIKPKSIITVQKPEVTSTETRKNPFFVVVALDSQGTAEGFLYWDDGDSLNTYAMKQYNLISFSASNNSVSSKVEHAGYNSPMPVSDRAFLIVRGVTSPVKAVTVNGQNGSFQYSADAQKLTVANPSKDIDLKTPFVVTWSF